MSIPTIEPFIVIVDQSETPEKRVVYQTTDGAETWEITGTCSACGACEVGAVNADYQIWTGVPVGQPGACLDSRFGTRPDIPVRPELTIKFASCTLKGKYLNAN